MSAFVTVIVFIFRLLLSIFSTDISIRRLGEAVLVSWSEWRLAKHGAVASKTIVSLCVQILFRAYFDLQTL